MRHVEVTTEEVATWTESQIVELKASLAQLDAGLEALCALLNADTARARVVFGVGPDGRVKGIEPDNLDGSQQKVAEKIRTKFDPLPHVTMTVYKCDGRFLLALDSERPRNVVAYDYDGRAFIREGTVNRVLKQGDRAQLNRRRNRAEHNGPWRCDTCGAIVGHISGIMISNTGVSQHFGHSCGGELWPL